METFAKVLSDRSRALLALIAETQPDSLAELAELSGRAKSNLFRTLKTMERYGLVHLRKGRAARLFPVFPIPESLWLFPLVLVFD
jgi:predicted transcriptional regulator